MLLGVCKVLLRPGNASAAPHERVPAAEVGDLKPPVRHPVVVFSGSSLEQGLQGVSIAALLVKLPDAAFGLFKLFITCQRSHTAEKLWQGVLL